jgi:RNA polymerase sigma factor (TIGR02999 family)
MTKTPPENVTRLAERAALGDDAAADELLPLVYDELRRLARARMAREPGGLDAQTLQPTGLVHEAWMRLVGEDAAASRWSGRAHFFGAAANAMRRVLVERARRRRRLKRGGGQQQVPLQEDAAAIAMPDPVDLVALDEALDRLAAVDARKAQIVTLRYFAGLSIEETAAALDLSLTTVKDEWMLARAILHRELSGRPGETGQ